MDASLWVSIASLVIAIAATFIAWASLAESKLMTEQGKQTAARAHADWAQQKWFDLYFKADQAFNALEHFQTENQGCNTAALFPEQKEKYNQLIHIIREAHTMAVVFPKSAAIDALFASTKFSNFWGDVLPKERLKSLGDALELLRQKALMDQSVLDTVLHLEK
jgi:hypothetical protein